MKKLNLDKEKLLNGLKVGCLVFLSLAGGIASTCLQNETENRIRLKAYEDADYSSAIDAIMNSNMYSCDKSKAISELPADKDNSFYSAIMAIARGKGCSDNKLSSIISISHK